MTAALDGIALDENMTWSDEDAWSPVRERVRPSVTGKPIVTHATLQYGRQITLEGYRGAGMWLRRSTVTALKALRDTGGYTGTLTLADGRTFNVRWDHARTPIEVEPIPLTSDPQADDFLRCILRFMEVPAV